MSTTSAPRDLTLQEKASLTRGADFWRTTAIEPADLPSIMVADGPNGLRKQSAASDPMAIYSSEPATCFPPAVALGGTFDPLLAHQVGQALAHEATAQGVSVLLGPGANIKRSPLCGRNFEYVSEDPIVSGVMAAALVNGLQSCGVGASLKHFALNNQEHERMRSSSDVAERPLREIYLRGFQRIVEDAQPWTVMASYNRINGVPACENPWLLTQVLRQEWGYQGVVMSDWFAVRDRVAALAAGLDLQMPSSQSATDTAVLSAISQGLLSPAALEAAAARVIALVDKSQHPTNTSGSFEAEAHHTLAREVAARSIVLLKNDGAVLPLGPDTTVAVIGAFASTPRFQGAGSGHVNPTQVEGALEHIRAASTAEVTYAPGYHVAAASTGQTTSDPSGQTTGQTTGQVDLVAEAVNAAASAQVVLLFLGLPETEESEGFDRKHLDLPPAQLELLQAVRQVNPRVVVVLSNGGVVRLPFAPDVPAIVETWLLGQAGGGAIADVLFGAVNPSAKLTETIPLRLQDTPAYGNFPGEGGHVSYGEGVLVGYRWYDHREMEVAYPFGHGLSYTTFEYSELAVDQDPGGNLSVSATITNTGPAAGREVVQVYTGLALSTVLRAPRELKAFHSVKLAAGASRRITMTVRRADLAYWDTRLGRFVVEGGDYTVAVAASSRDIRAQVSHTVAGDDVRLPLSMLSTAAEVLADPVAGAALTAMLAPVLASLGLPAPHGAEEAAASLSGLGMGVSSMPIGNMIAFLGSQEYTAAIEAVLAQANSSH
mgnify:CR=1 FL=1